MNKPMMVQPSRIQIQEQDLSGMDKSRFQQQQQQQQQEQHDANFIQPPPLPTPRLLTTPSQQHRKLVVSEDAVAAALRTSARHSAAARSGITSDHLRSLAKVSPYFISSLTLLANLAVNNAIPPEVASYLWGGNVTPLTKPDGGIRPIIPVESLARLICRAVLCQQKPELIAALNTIQTSMQPDGAGALITTLRTTLQAQPDYVVLCLDIRNAFGTIERDAIRAGLKQLKLPHYLKIFDQIYGQPNHLLVRTTNGDRSISVKRGVLQGETLSAFFFCAGLQPALLAAQQEIGDSAHIMAYADDIYIVGQLNHVNNCFCMLNRHLNNIGLQVKQQKCRLACASSDRVFAAQQAARLRLCPVDVDNIISLETHAINILGVPIGAAADIQQQLDDKASQLADDLNLLTTLQNKQTALLLLRYCCVHKINHTIRNLPPSITRDCAIRHDQSITTSLSWFVSPSILDDDAILQARLPLNQGGLGLTSAEQTAPAAYLAGLADALRISESLFPALHSNAKTYLTDATKPAAAEITDLVEHFNQLRQQRHSQLEMRSRPATTTPTRARAGRPARNANPPPQPPPPPPPPPPRTVLQALSAPPKEQKRLTQLIHHKNYLSYERTAIKNNRVAHAISLKQRGASAFLEMCPSSRETCIPSAHMRIALCTRLCLDTHTVPPDRTVCDYCGKDVRTAHPNNPLAWDYHIETCHLDGYNTRRHKHIQTVIAQAAAQLGQPSELAPVLPGSDKHLRGDLVFDHLPGRDGLRGLVVDFSIVHHSSQSSPVSEWIPLGKSTARAQEKIAKYRKACADIGRDFMPVVFETTGAIGYSAQDFISLLVSNSTSLPQENVTNSDYHRLTSLIAATLVRCIGDKYIAMFNIYSPSSQKNRHPTQEHSFSSHLVSHHSQVSMCA